MTDCMLFLPPNPHYPFFCQRPAWLPLIPVGYENTHTVSRWSLWLYRTELRLTVCLSVQSPFLSLSLVLKDFKGHLLSTFFHPVLSLLLFSPLVLFFLSARPNASCCQATCFVCLLTSENNCRIWGGWERRTAARWWETNSRFHVRPCGVKV